MQNTIVMTMQQGVWVATWHGPSGTTPTTHTLFWFAGMTSNAVQATVRAMNPTMQVVMS